jgi:O-antigen/teichoic acid export membrane protein
MALSLPLVTALYEPKHVGDFALALVYAQIGAILVTGRLEQVLPRLDANERWTGLRVTSLLAVAGLVAWGAVSTGLLGSPERVALALLLLASVAANNVVGFVALAEQRFSQLARMRLANGVMTGLCHVVGGLIFPDAATLIIGYALGNLVAVAMAMSTVGVVRRRSSRIGLRGLVATQSLGWFALTVGGAGVMSTAALALPVIALDRLYGPAVVGSFFIARKLLMVPTQLVASTASEVTYAMVATESPNVVRERVARWLRSLRVAALIIMALGAVLAPVVEVVVPSGYEALWQVTLLLTVPAAAQLLATSLSNILLAIHEERIRLMWNAGRLIGLVVLLALAGWADFYYVTTVAVLSGYLTVTYLVLLALTLRALNRKGAAA